MPHTAYIVRDGIEFEVNGTLFAYGEGYSDSWSDTGTEFIVESNPMFVSLVCYDDNGGMIPLSEDETTDVIDQMTVQYWSRY